MIVRFAKPEDFVAMLHFQKEIYRGNSNYRDHQSRTLKALFAGKMEIQKKSEIVPIVAEKNNQIVGMAFLAVIDRMADKLQIAFLEMRNDFEIAKAIVDFAKEFAKERRIRSILIGLNFHVNYGLGLLASDFDKVQSIGSAYNPAYYTEHLEKLATTTKNLVSYKGLIEDIKLNPSPALEQRMAQFEVRHADFQHIEKTAKIYGRINNLAFAEHEYYYESREAEDIELFNEYKLFLKPENLLFAYKDDLPVGFILWYPDFNQLISGGQELGLMAFLKSRFLPGLIDTLKFTEFGIIPKYRRSAALYALLKHCYELNKEKYRFIESGWILDDNSSSKNVTTHFIKKESKHYKVFEINL